MTEVTRPTGLTRLLLRLPVHCYRLGLGGLFGGRLLLITHVGRVTGTPRRTVVEVIRREAPGGAYLVASGWGPDADWYRNLLRTPRATIQVGRRTTQVTAVPLPREEATELLAGYFRRHRVPAKLLLPRLFGYPVDGSEADFRKVAQRMPVLRLVPTG